MQPGWGGQKQLWSFSHPQDSGENSSSQLGRGGEGEKKGHEHGGVGAGHVHQL